MPGDPTYRSGAVNRKYHEAVVKRLEDENAELRGALILDKNALRDAKAQLSPTAVALLEAAHTLGILACDNEQGGFVDTGPHVAERVRAFNRALLADLAVRTNPKKG